MYEVNMYQMRFGGTDEGIEVIYGLEQMWPGQDVTHYKDNTL